MRKVDDRILSEISRYREINTYINEQEAELPPPPADPAMAAPADPMAMPPADPMAAPPADPSMASVPEFTKYVVSKGSGRFFACNLQSSTAGF